MKSFDFFLIKREWLVIVVACITLHSCDSFKSKDELLTQDKWVLYRRYFSSTSNMDLYKKADQALTFKFDKDGTITITEENGSKSATVKWYWTDKEKKYITLDKGKYTGNFHVVELTGKELQWSKSDIYSSDNTLETFKHLDDSDWND